MWFRHLTLILTAAIAAFAQQQPAPPAIPSDIQADLDVEYSRVGERVAMDILRPKGATAANPTIVAIHGGGFRRGSRTSYIPFCIKAARQGYTCATVSYRFAPRHQFPAPVEDVKAAVRFLRANAAKYNIDPDRIGATGGSAGAHLALMLGLTGSTRLFEGSGPNQEQSSKVQCVGEFYGPTDFTQSYGKSVDAAEVLPIFIGNDLQHNREGHLKASPLYYVTPMSSPILAVHGDKDAYVAVEQSIWLTDKLRAAGVAAELEIIPGAGHGFKGADLEKAEVRLMAYFDKQLKAKEQLILISDHGPKKEIVAMMWPSGRQVWTVPNGGSHDVQPLPGGGALLSYASLKKVVEVDSKQKEVWSCCEGMGLEHPLAAQRLPNGNTLIGDAKVGKVIEVTPDKKLVWEYKSDDLANMRSRNSNRTPAGTTLIAVEAVGKLIEVDQNKNIIWTYQAADSKRRLYVGHRLENGNTMISLSDPGEVIEVDKAGKVLRSVGGANLGFAFGWNSGIDVLPNGNWLLNDYTGRRIVEVDKAGNLVNELRLGPRTVASLAVVK